MEPSIVLNLGRVWAAHLLGWLETSPAECLRLWSALTLLLGGVRTVDLSANFRGDLTSVRVSRPTKTFPDFAKINKRLGQAFRHFLWNTYSSLKALTHDISVFFHARDEWNVSILLKNGQKIKSTDKLDKSVWFRPAQFSFWHFTVRVISSLHPSIYPFIHPIIPQLIQISSLIYRFYRQSIHPTFSCHHLFIHSPISLIIIPLSTNLLSSTHLSTHRSPVQQFLPPSIIHPPTNNHPFTSSTIHTSIPPFTIKLSTHLVIPPSSIRPFPLLDTEKHQCGSSYQCDLVQCFSLLFLSLWENCFQSLAGSSCGPSITRSLTDGPLPHLFPCPVTCFRHAWCRPPWTWLVCLNYTLNCCPTVPPVVAYITPGHCRRISRHHFLLPGHQELSVTNVDHKTPSLTSIEPSVMEPRICDQTQPTH